MKTNAKNEVFRRLGSPTCASCGSVGARQQIVTVQHVLVDGEEEQDDWLNGSTRFDSDHHLFLCSGPCAHEIVGEKVYIVVANGKLSPHPTLDQKPLGVIRQIKPRLKNGDAIGVEWGPK